MYKLYHYYLCPSSRFVRLVLEENKIEYETQLDLSLDELLPNYKPYNLIINKSKKNTFKIPLNVKFNTKNNKK